MGHTLSGVGGITLLLEDLFENFMWLSAHYKDPVVDKPRRDAAHSDAVSVVG